MVSDACHALTGPNVYFISVPVAAVLCEPMARQQGQHDMRNSRQV